MLNKQYFVTGTDTEVGKSFVTAALLARAKRLNLTGFGFKPIAAGAHATEQGLRNEDGVLLQHYSAPSFEYSQHNPVCFAEPQSPHLCGDTTVAQLLELTQKMPSADVTLIEGAGGWLVPINRQQTLADYALALQLPVILVIDIKLGCINHALLTARAIELPIAGWVANNRRDNPSNMIKSIAERLSAPLLGTINRSTIEQAADNILLPFEC